MKNTTTKQRSQRTKRNAWAGKQEEVESLKAEIYDLRRKENLKEFVEMFKENMGVLAAYTPRAEWPGLVETAFKNTAQKAEMAAELYLEGHP